MTRIIIIRVNFREVVFFMFFSMFVFSVCFLLPKTPTSSGSSVGRVWDSVGLDGDSMGFGGVRWAGVVWGFARLITRIYIY